MANTYFDTAQITGQVASLGDPLIDDFEDQDFAEYAGDTGSASIVTSPVANGSYAAGLEVDQTEIRSTSGLDNYPAQGDIWRFKTYIPSGGIPRFYWGVQDSSNYYYVEFDEPASTLRFVKVDAGSATTLATDSVTFDTGVYSETKIEWRSTGRQVIEHFDSAGNVIGVAAATDTTFTSGGVGWAEWSAATASSNQLGWWKLDAGSGSTATDSAGSNDGTINGAAWSTDAKTGGYSLDFDGTDDNVDLADVYDTNGSLSTGSWGCWVKHDTLPSNDGNSHSYFTYSTEMRLLGRDDAGDKHDCYIFDGGNTVNVQSPLAGTGIWEHVVVTWDSNSIIMYVDGSQVDSAGGTSGPNPLASEDHRIGAVGSSTSPMNGHIDDVRLYDTKLTASEVQTWYDNTV